MPDGAQVSLVRRGWPRETGCDLTGKETPEVGAALSHPRSLLLAFGPAEQLRDLQKVLGLSEAPCGRPSKVG